MAIINQTTRRENYFLQTKGTRQSPPCLSQHKIFLRHAAVHVLTLTLESAQKLPLAPKAFITHDELSVVGKSRHTRILKTHLRTLISVSNLQYSE